MIEQKLRLGGLVSIAKGRKHNEIFYFPRDGSKRYIQIDDLRNDDNLKFTVESGTEVGMDDVIIAWDGANAGTIGFGLSGYIGSTLARLKIMDPVVYPKYLGRFLRCKSAVIRERCSGATIPHVNKSFLQSIEIPLPPLLIQKQIVDILEEADSAREKRRQANQLTDQFLQSAFLEMFGDPVTNPKGWSKLRLDEVCSQMGDLRCGPFGSQLKKADYKPAGIPVWDIEDVKAAFKNPPRFFVTSEKSVELSNYHLQVGDIVMTRRATIGICAVYPKRTTPGVMHSALLRVRVNKDIADPNFLSHELSVSKYVKDQISEFSSGAIFESINVSKLKSVKVLVPPITEQQKFTMAAEGIESLRTKQWESEKQLENLFQSLMQRAFRGELVS